MVKINDIFEVKYGVNLELNKLELDAKGINFVSRTSKNNGVSAKVRMLSDITPLPAGVITASGGGSVLESFVQPEPFYSGRDLYYLTPKCQLSLAEKLYYCLCIRANKYKYSYGRQANKTLKDILIPSKSEIPSWVYSTSIPDLADIQRPVIAEPIPDLWDREWNEFTYGDIFKLENGYHNNIPKVIGDTPFLSACVSNNGIVGYCNKEGLKVIIQPNCIAVFSNGNCGEALYVPEEIGEFGATHSLVLIRPLLANLNPFIAMFLVTLIRKERFRYNYGYKWRIERMRASRIKLPSTKTGTPDWEFMENYIKTLKYSSNLA